MIITQNKHPIVLIIQARMGSTRLPGKVMKAVGGKPLLSYLLERVKAAQLVNQVVVATTESIQDQPIVQLCHELDVSVFRGSEQDVLDRYYQAAKKYKAGSVVRVTSDCPLIDPQVIDRVISEYLSHAHYDYVSNMLRPGYPRGMDVEVFSFHTLQQIRRVAKAPEEREHVTLFIYEHPEQFSIGCVESEKNLSSQRWTVDTEEDFQLISLLINALYKKNALFSIDEIAEEMTKHPDWFSINSKIKQKPVR